MEAPFQSSTQARKQRKKDPQTYVDEEVQGLPGGAVGGGDVEDVGLTVDVLTPGRQVHPFLHHTHTAPGTSQALLTVIVSFTTSYHTANDLDNYTKTPHVTLELTMKSHQTSYNRACSLNRKTVVTPHMSDHNHYATQQVSLCTPAAIQC